MTRPKKILWRTRETAPESFFNIKSDMNRLLLQLLWNRGVRDKTGIDSFLTPNISHIHDPFLFTRMKQACERVFEAIKNNEIIAIHGDYDADGIGGTIILHETISELGGKTHVFLPLRDTLGYGLNDKTVEEFHKLKVKLIISCDCGISNISETALANSLGIDVIISDHHQFKDDLPNAHSILHPKLKHEIYPDKHLSGCAVAFKLAQGLLRLAKINNHSPAPNDIFEYEQNFLDLVAISTIADMSPLLGESRVISMLGIKQLQNTKRIGLQALLSKKKGDLISVRDIAFSISPKINAPGRIANPRIAFDLLSAKDEISAANFLSEIETLNNKRRAVTDEAVKQACKQITEENQTINSVLFAYNPNWPPGIIGLIAGRLKDKFEKPAFAMCSRNNEIVGSGRSIAEINIVDALQDAQKYLSKFGGHAQACGFSLKNSLLLPYFEQAMHNFISKNNIDFSLLPRDVDCEIGFGNITSELIRDLEMFEPHGKENEKPVFLTRNVRVENARVVGTDEKTLQLECSDANGILYKLVGFGKSDYIREINLGDQIDVSYELGINEWNGNCEIQLSIIDISRN